MNNDDEYRRQAADAQAFADKSISETDKAAWLRIAQSWLALVRRPKQSQQEAFDADVRSRGTGQESSNKSN